MIPRLCPNERQVQVQRRIHDLAQRGDAGRRALLDQSTGCGAELGTTLRNTSLGQRSTPSTISRS